MAKKKSLKAALVHHQGKVAERNRRKVAAENAARITGRKGNPIQSSQNKILSGNVPATGPPRKGKLKGKGRSIMPFEKYDHVLLVGEGNFSFSHALLSPCFQHLSLTLTASSYDTEAECLLKYPNNDAQLHIEALRKAGVKVLFGVDARKLEACKQIKGTMKRQGSRWNGWNKIVFNFPHVGAGITDQDRNILTNQHLLLDFLASVAPLLSKGSPPKYLSSSKQSKKPESDDEDEIADVPPEEEDTSTNRRHPDNTIEQTSFEPVEGSFTSKHGDYGQPAPDRQGSVLITLRDSPPYTLWNLPKLAKRPPVNPSHPTKTQPRFSQARSFSFHPEAYPGYEHRRTIGFVHGANEDILRNGANGPSPCRTWEFRLRNQDDSEEV